MRNEIKELSAKIDVLDNQITVLRTMLSPVMRIGINTVTNTLLATQKEQVDTRSEVAKSIFALSQRITELSSFVDDTAKNLDLGEG